MLECMLLLQTRHFAFARAPEVRTKARSSTSELLECGLVAVLLTCAGPLLAPLVRNTEYVRESLASWDCCLAPGHDVASARLKEEGSSPRFSPSIVNLAPKLQVAKDRGRSKSVPGRTTQRCILSTYQTGGGKGRCGVFAAGA